jgi:tetratricopeptide (TPR) repeat protein
MKPALIPRLLASLALSSLAAAHADVLEDIDVRREGVNAVVQIRLAMPISFVRATASRTSDLTQAYYRVRPSLSDKPSYVPGERRVVEIKGLPVITIEDEPVQTGFLQDPNRRLVMALGQASKFKVRTGKGDRSIELVLEGLGSKVPDDAGFLKMSSAALSPDQNYVIALLRSSSPKLSMDLPVPQSLQQYQVFTSRRLVQGKQVHEMDLGYFSTLAEAEAALKLLKDRFPQSVIVQLQTQAAAPAPEADVLPLKSATALQDNDSQARSLLEQGRQQYEQRQFDDALNTLNQALTLPVTATTPDTQELLGQVLAAMGENGRAEAEFTAYLKQYPEGPGAQRVREALAALKPLVISGTAIDGSKKPEVVETVTGSISQYYYGGKQTQAQRAERNVDGTPVPANALSDLNQAPLTNDAQKLLSTSADATWRNRNDQREMKLFVRDQLDYNLLSRETLKAKSRYRNRLSAAYFDYLGLDKTRLRARLGRQNASWGGESRYDGASGSFSFRPKWKASAAVGSPVDGVADAKRYFVGTSMDADALTPNLGASVFVLQRMIDGEVDRRSVGTDVRYFAGNGNIMGAVDYDTIYRKTNRTSLQGTYTADNNATYTVATERTALYQVSLSQALFFNYAALSNNGILPPRSIQELKATTGYNTAQLRQFVRSNVSYFGHSFVSGTWPVTTDWQVAADYHLQSTGAIAPNEAIGLPQGQAATGLVRSLGMQAIGTNLYSARDTNTFGVNTTRGRLGRSLQFNTNHSVSLNEAWQLDPGLQWVRSTTLTTLGAVQATTVSWGPTFRASFKPRPSVTLESNLSISRSNTVNHDVSTQVDTNTGQSTTTATTTTSSSNLLTYYLGYRYEY